jgi:RNA polymerase sporulation-specific sigma factor
MVRRANEEIKRNARRKVDNRPAYDMVSPLPVSRELEAELVQRKLAGDKEARDTLIIHNVRLVAHIARKIGGQQLVDEHIDVGLIGLIKAVDSYRPDKRTKLATYIAACVTNEYYMMFRKTNRLKTIESLDAELPPKGANLSGDDGINTLADMLISEDDTLDSAERSVLIAQIRSALSALPEKLQYLICAKYGVFGYAKRQRQEVARIIGMSRAYVSRLTLKAESMLAAEVTNSKGRKQYERECSTARAEWGNDTV